MLALGLRILATGLLLDGVGNAAPGRDSQQLNLVPFPKAVEIGEGAFSLAGPLVFQVAGPHGEQWGQILNAELRRAGGAEAKIEKLDGVAAAFRLGRTTSRMVSPALPNEGGVEAYALEVRANEVVCAGRELAGAFYGLQTLCQLIRANRQGTGIPAVGIRDWPSLRWRCFQDDMTRGPSSTLETLEYEAAMGAYLKLNLMTFYMEYQYAFKKHPKIGPTNGSLSPENLSELVRFVKPLQMDILGNQQSFGHFGWILRHPEYADLRENSDVLTPAREKTYKLLDDMYSEVCPLLPFPWFNVCCDETWGLGTGPSRELTNKLGVGGVYVGHIRRVHDLLKDKYQKRMMMWGDIILQHPDKLEQVPKDTIMLTWGYDARRSFEDQIIPFAKSGYEFFVCPGVNNWSRILPDFGVAITNIQNFVRDGVKHGAIGMLNTDWEDDGEAINAVKWHADAWAAECAWNAAKTPLEDFHRRVGAVLFGTTGEHFSKAIGLLAQTHRLSGMKGMNNARFWEKDFVPKARAESVQRSASNLLALVRPAMAELEVCRKEARCNERILDAYLLGARRMELIGQRMLDGLEAAKMYEGALEGGNKIATLERIEQLVRRNRDAHEKIGKDFATIWLSESQPYALDWTLKRYTNVVSEFDALLRKVATARERAQKGEALPSAEEIGLAMGRPTSRTVKPQEKAENAMWPFLPWLDSGAKHRMGVVVRAAGAERVNLPMELEIDLPEYVGRKGARAFIVDKKGLQREIPAQIEPMRQQKGRLVVVLPGTLAKDADACIHAYFLDSANARDLPGAVRAANNTGGMHWLENDRVRLLLGEEGAHIYRWEVKGATNRDMTMPGQNGWAGFSDMATHRHCRHSLTCNARGPALVEFQCTDRACGVTKTISLYASASWVETMLSEPTPVYWDFDDPRNFAADGPTPGMWLFSNGRSGKVGPESEGVPAQVKAANTYWGIKYNENKLALGLVTPEVASLHCVAPGAGAGGVGIEGGPPAQHFVTFCGVLEGTPAETMNRLQSTLDLKRRVEVRAYPIQAKE